MTLYVFVVHKSNNRYDNSVTCVYVTLHKLETISTAIISFTYINRSVNEERLDSLAPIIGGGNRALEYLSKLLSVTNLLSCKTKSGMQNFDF